MRNDGLLDGLRKEAEHASSEMRLAAFELHEIARALPNRSTTRVRRHQIELLADRLEAAAALLTAEVAAASPRTVGWTASIGRRALLAGATLALAVATGGAEGAGLSAYDRYVGHQISATQCLERIERDSDSVTTAMLEEVDTRLDQIAETLREISTREPSLANHPAYWGVRESSRIVDRDIDRFDRIGALVEAAMNLRDFKGPLSDYEDVPEVQARMSKLNDEINGIGSELNELRVEIASIEPMR